MGLKVQVGDVVRSLSGEYIVWGITEDGFASEVSEVDTPEIRQKNPLGYWRWKDTTATIISNIRPKKKRKVI